MYGDIIPPEAEEGERNSSGLTCPFMTWAGLSDFVTAFSYRLPCLSWIPTQQLWFGMVFPSHSLSNPQVIGHNALVVSLN